jgi:hypothetical protein
LLILFALWAFQSLAAASEICVGDCNGDGSVTGDDIANLVHAIFGDTVECEGFGSDAPAGAHNLVAAIQSLLRGCLTPTPTRILQTPTRTFSPTPTVLTTPIMFGQDEVDANPGGTAIGIAVPASTGSILEVLADTTPQGTTLRIDVSNASACGTAIGGCQVFLPGSIVVWDSPPTPGRDLTGTFRFVFANGSSFVGTLAIPGAGVSGSPYDVQTYHARVTIHRE